MENLLLHSASGMHILFKNHEIREALQHSPTQPSNTSEKRKKVEVLISNLIERSSLLEKISYLQDLDPESYSLLVHTYLEIVEGASRNLHPHIH